MTLREAIEEAESRLKTGPHPERARRDAESLLLHVLHQDRAWLRQFGDDELSPDELAGFKALADRRFAGEPIQYILGEVEFFGLPLNVAPGVLIPRPETEHLVEEVIRLAQGLPAPRIADIGTGSGAISIALAHALPAAHISTVDVSEEALRIARGNARRNHVDGRIHFLRGDLLEPLAGQLFDVIASNPPYVPLADVDSLSVEVREFEPHGALFAGADGLDIYRRLIPAACAHLASGGWLVMEIGYGQHPEIERMLHASGYSEIRFVADYQGISRVAIGRFCE